MKTSSLVEGLQILAKYRTKGLNGFDTGAEHDVLYAYATDRPVEMADLKRLVKLGWRQDHWCDDEEKNLAENYSINESWMAFT